MKEEIEELLATYKRRLNTIEREKYRFESGMDSHKRLTTKGSCYRTIITELEKIISDGK